MRIFLWVMVVICAIDVLSRIGRLATGADMERSNAGEAWNAIANTGLLVWASVLLATA